MRAFFWSILVIIILFFGGLFVLVWPNTYLSQINISYWPKPMVRSFLTKKSNETMSVIVDGRETKISYADLGMELDIEKTMETLKIVSLTDLINKWLDASQQTTLVQPVFIFGDMFEKLVALKFPNRPLRNEKATYVQRTGLFTYAADERKARIDTVDLQVKLIMFTGVNKKPIVVNMIEETGELEKRVENINKNLKLIQSKPLEITVEGRDQKISLNSKEVLDLLNVETKDSLNTVDLTVNKEKVRKLLADNDISKMSTNWAVKVIEDNLTARYGGEVPKPVVLGADTGPNTTGSVAEKYIEVDLSQQKMYFFEKGELFKTYMVSTGLNYRTPVGSYKIQNKIPMGFSNIFKVWMPWWMAFDYREDIGAYLGIHELPYRLDAGQKIYRFGNYIGNRKTGGCIALSPGDSKEVYDKSFPGMDLVVFE